MNSNTTDQAFYYIEERTNWNALKTQMALFRNLSIFFFIALALAFSVIFVLLIMVLVSIFPKCLPFLEKIKTLIFFNPILRFSLQSYLKFCEIAFLYFQNEMLSDSQTQTDTTPSSLTTSIIALVYISVTPIFTWIFLNKN
jgi:hypothetical protein